MKEVTLQVNRGERLAVMGPSGSGKTSLLLIAAGLEKASSGRVVFDGQDITGLNEDQLATFRRGTVGVVFQNFHLIPTMTALENVAVPLEVAGVKNAFSRARDALESVALSKRAEHFPSQLSGGEQQRVALARAIAIRPKLLLADEPTGNLDQETGRQIVELMFTLQRDFGTSLLLITHDASLAASCDRTVCLRDGRIAA